MMVYDVTAMIPSDAEADDTIAEPRQETAQKNEQSSEHRSGNESFDNNERRLYEKTKQKDVFV